MASAGPARDRSIVDTAQARIEICPNCALSVRGATVFFLSVAAVCFGIAGFFTWQGFWPVLPFAGLEMTVLGWALHGSLARRFHRQTITVTESAVSVESRDRLRIDEVTFPRHWAQVKIYRPHSRLHPSRLTIESHGRRCELGSFLTEEERRGLAQRLRRLIGRVNESPPLAGPG